MKDGKLRENVGFIKKENEKKHGGKKRNDFMSIVTLQRAEEEKSARVAERCSTRFVPGKTVRKKSSKSRAGGMKNAVKVTKKRRL